MEWSAFYYEIILPKNCSFEQGIPFLLPKMVERHSVLCALGASI
jgi:hypothetical protein